MREAPLEIAKCTFLRRKAPYKGCAAVCERALACASWLQPAIASVQREQMTAHLLQEFFAAVLLQKVSEPGVVTLCEAVFLDEKECLLHHAATGVLRLKDSGKLVEKYGLRGLGCRKFNPVAENRIIMFS